MVWWLLGMGTVVVVYVSLLVVTIVREEHQMRLAERALDLAVADAVRKLTNNAEAAKAMRASWERLKRGA